MTVPDIRDMGIGQYIDDRDIIDLGLENPKTAAYLSEAVGKVVAGIIAVALVVFDGEIGIAAAIAVMGTLAGMTTLSKTK